MAKDHVMIDVTAPGGYGQELREYARRMQATKETGEKLENLMDHMHIASPADYTMIETRFGLPSGAGKPVFDAIVAANNAMDNVSIVAIIEQLG